MLEAQFKFVTSIRSVKDLLPVLYAALLISIPIAKTNADTLTVAVASNFAETLESIALSFEQAQPHTLTLVRGSSGRHYAQIVNGAPFELFFSADSTRVQALVDEGVVSSENTRTYAIGQLVLWSPTAKDGEEIASQLQTISFERLAIANPRLAPYGQAAIEVLESLGLEELINTRQIVTGENVAQAYQFVATGNADLGFLALSQLIAKPTTQYWRIPLALYEPIAQQLAVLTESPASRSFLEYLEGPEAQTIILQHGYRLPENN